MGFQKTVNIQPAPACAGDFASANMRNSVLSGSGAFVAGANISPVSSGPIIGNFAWGNQSTGIAYSINLDTANSQIGFVHREQQGFISTFLAESGVVIQPGYSITLHSQGDFWAKFAAGGTIGQKVFAKYTDGSCTSAAAGTSTQEASVTAAIAVTTGVMTVSAVGSGALAVGQLLSGSGMPAGTYITAQLTGSAGSTGTYQTNTATAVSSTTVTAASKVETAFYVRSTSAAGELSMISTNA